jgi:hypothetical protein
MEPQSQISLAESLLIPDAEDAQLVQKPAARPVLVFRMQRASTAKKRQHKQRPKRRAIEKYSVEQAFDYFYGPTSSDAHDKLNQERAIRAVAFLLTYCSEHGNRSLDGFAANGLARILELSATRIGAR